MYGPMNVHYCVVTTKHMSLASHSDQQVPGPKCNQPTSTLGGLTIFITCACQIFIKYAIITSKLLFQNNNHEVIYHRHGICLHLLYMFTRNCCIFIFTLVATLFISQETTARDVVMLALRQFGISEHSSELQNMSCNNYSMCEVSVEHGGLVKQKRLPESACNLADKIGVHSR